MFNEGKPAGYRWQRVGEGWDYPPGANVSDSVARQGQLAMNKAINLPPLLAAQAVRAYLDDPTVIVARQQVGMAAGTINQDLAVVCRILRAAASEWFSERWW